jgi:mutator family transposase
MGFLDYDVEIRKIICSTNAIESLNAHYRRAARARGHFPTEQAALKCFYLVARSLDRPDAARHAESPDASMTTATICARLSPAPAARRSTATKPTVTPPTTKPARHRYPSPEAKTAPSTWTRQWNHTSGTRHVHQTGCPWNCLGNRRPTRLITAYRDGATAASLATAHGLSLKSVKRLLHSAGVRRTPPTRRATKATPVATHP